jgi:LPXTG-motif cell wall-anchored protein
MPFSLPAHRADPARARLVARRVLAGGVATLLAVGVVTTAAPSAPVTASVAALSCDQNTLYAVGRDKTLRAIDLSSTVAPTTVATFPNANNGLGISAGGKKAYALVNSTTADTVFDTYDTDAAVPMSSTTGIDPGGRTILRGGVDPSNGLYYYANGDLSPKVGGVDTTTAPPTGLGQVATVDIPGAVEGTPEDPRGNGDLAFSRSGTMFLLYDQMVQRVGGELPSAKKATPEKLPSTNVATLAASTRANGVAFSQDGYLFLSALTGVNRADTTITKVDPTSGAVVGTPRTVKGVAITDLASCNYPNTTSSTTTMDERKDADDGFTISLTGDNAPDRAPVTASTGQGVDTATAGPILAVGGATYTVEQKPGSTTSAADYATTWQCADGTSKPVSDGFGSKASYTQPRSTSESSSEISCTFTNVLAGTATADTGVDAVSGEPTVLSQLTANDVGTGLKITSVTQGSQGGQVVLNPGGTVTYTPSTAFSGTETFTYTVTDAGGNTSTATVTTTVTPRAADDADIRVPAVPADATGAAATTTIPAAALLGNDAGAGLHLTDVTVTSGGGSASVDADGNVAYSPVPGASGPVTLSYTVADSSGATSTATAAVIVEPKAVDDAKTVAGGQSTTFTDLRGDDRGTGLEIVDAAVLTGGGSVAVTKGDVTYTPEPGFSGVATISYTIHDASGTPSTATVTITVKPAPVGDTKTATSGVATTFTDLRANDQGVDLTITAVTQGSAGGAVSITGAGDVSYTPAATFSGTETFEYTTTDAAGNTEQAVVTVTVAPRATDDARTAPVGGTVTWKDLAGNDAGSALVVTSVTGGRPGSTVTLAPDGSVSYTAPAGYSGTDAFTYVVTDGAGQVSAPATVTVTIAPTAGDDARGTTTDAPVTLSDLRANDAGSLLTITAVGDPGKGGSASLGSDGSVTYTPLKGFSGTETFTYTVTDSASQSRTATVTMTVAPVATDDAYRTSVDVPLTLTDLRANDRGTALRVTAVSACTVGGTAVVSDRDVVFTPGAGWSGVDTFTYTATDVEGQQVTATVTVTVVPTAVDDEGTAQAGTPVTLAALRANDAGDALRVTAVRGTSAGGAVSVTPDGDVAYTAASGFSGRETFDYEVTDSASQTATATVVMTVSPTAVADRRLATADTTVALTGLRDNDLGRGLRITSVARGDQGGTATIGADGDLRYTPAIGFSGVELLDYTVTDSSGGTSTTTVTIVVAPTGSPDTRRTVVGQRTVFSLLGDLHGRGFRLMSVSDPKHGVADFTESGTVSYVPLDGFSGVDTFGYRVVDQADQPVEDTITITVTPTATVDSFRTAGDTAITLSQAQIVGNDRGSDLTVATVGDPSSGSIARGADGSVVFTPAKGFAGTVTFPYTAVDSSALEAESVVTIVVDAVVTPPVTDPPVTTPPVTDPPVTDPPVTTPPVTDPPVTTPPVTDPPVTTPPVTDPPVTTPPVTDPPVTTPPVTDPPVTTPPVTDPPVTTPDDGPAPVAVPDSGTLTAGAGHDLVVRPGKGVLSNDSGTGLAVALDGAPLHGTVELAADGSFTYTPDAGFSGTDTFTYTLTDASGRTPTGVVTIVVTPTAVDDAAHVRAGGTLTLGGSGSHAAHGLLDNDWGSSLLVVGHAEAAHGTLSIGSDGSVTYVPAPGFSGVDVVTYDVVDAEGRTSSATLTVTVDVSAVDDAGSTIAGRPLTVPADRGLLANDSGTSLTAALATPPSHGTVTVAADGSYVYTPTAGFSGVDTFTYTATDADGASTTATATITVVSAAAAEDDHQVGLPGRPVTVDPIANDTPTGGSQLDPSTVVVVDPATGEGVPSVTVPGFGTWTAGDDGMVTFTPVPGLVGDASIEYQVTDTAGQTITGTITVSYPTLLAFTGSDSATAAVGAGVLLLLAGLALVLLRRRRPVGPLRRPRH